MCWSQRSSIVSFLLGSSACLYLFFRDVQSDRIYAIFFQFVIFMQFLEFLIWSDQPSVNKNCNSSPYEGKINNVASQIASVQNLLQPLVAGLLVLYYINPALYVFPSFLLKIIVGFYGVVILWWILTVKVYTKKLCTIPINGRHLDWPWIKSEISGNFIWVSYFTTLALVMISILKIPGGKTLSAYLVVTMIISMSIYPFKKAAGSWWCVAAVGAPWLKILFPKTL